MVLSNEIAKPLNIGQFLVNIREKIIDELPEVATRDGSPVVRVIGESLPIYSQKDSDPIYDIIITVSQSIVDHASEEFTGMMMFNTTVQALCTFRIALPDENLHLRAINDAHRILFWARTALVEGMSTLSIPFTGGVERIELLDPELQPNVDVTREGYRVYWEVEFAYHPDDDASPFDVSFQVPSNNAEDLEVIINADPDYEYDPDQMVPSEVDVDIVG